MKDSDKSKEELISELAEMRQRIAGLEASKAAYQRMEEALKESKQKYQLLAENAADVIWTVDLDMNLIYISPSVVRLLGYTPKEARARKMAEVFTPASFEAAMEVLGEELERERRGEGDPNRSRTLELDLVHKDSHAVPAEISYSFLRQPDGRATQILAISRDISKRREAEEKIRRSTEKLVNALEKTVQAMAMIVEMRDPYTAGHQRRVTQLAGAIAEKMGLSEEQISALRLAGLIHDVGKVRVPAEILTNPDGLSDAEFSMIKMHPLIGYEILKTMELPWPIAEIVHQHHERLDGSGYPSGKAGEDIILEARILAVADVVEAIASHRPYRAALGIDTALAEISKKSGILYDPKAVSVCLKLFREEGFKFD
jgi:PAS domain S-box-containing protein/putative nucleotidyltransferase with HDIG domain